MLLIYPSTLDNKIAPLYSVTCNIYINVRNWDLKFCCELCTDFQSCQPEDGLLGWSMLSWYWINEVLCLTKSTVIIVT
jgi:hypothetical protein